MTLYSDRQTALREIKEIDSSKKDYLIIHYACENFYEENGQTSRIISIAVRKLDDGQTTLFSILQAAELKKIPLNQIKYELDTLEKELLRRFFKFVKMNNHKKWIHWSMRDQNYGFKAIEHRYEVLGSRPEIISDDNKFDLALMLVNIYGQNYAPKSKMQNLIKLNDIDQRDFLSGAEEAEAIKNLEYSKVNMSTASKVELFSKYISLVVDNKLKTNTKVWTLYGTSLKGRYLSLRETRFYLVAKYIFNLLIGGIAGILVERFIF
ncbi:hypothetical protein [Enterococcus durans]|uniref:hypothetical protein n=1 Tax=Enterococcus durans TaxID=53345 RepID=UPI00189C7EEE|nr:hypothetical protein [Enterococcus durans]MDB1681425.1 hypothetical protein [Enterococcus durans]